MAMTCEEMVAFYHEQAQQTRQALEAAQASSDYHHAAYLIGWGFRECLMEGLIRWRIGMGSPVAPIRESVAWIREGVEVLRSLGAIPAANDIPLAQASIVGFLLDAPAFEFDPGVLKMDCLLDAALADALRDQWDGAMWAEGIGQLESEGRCALSIETYLTYYQLLRSPGADLEKLVERATELFDKRRDDEFYMGGPQTEGGDLDNSVTVDYSLAAILKKLQYTGENVHRWRWG